MHLAVGLDPSIFRSHPRLPPRFITVVDRSGLHGRGIFNNYVLQQAVEATGLPYRILPKLDELTFKEQVELMAGTGILIAPHGAHLANLAFMPARSAVIEVRFACVLQLSLAFMPARSVMRAVVVLVVLVVISVAHTTTRVFPSVFA